MEAPPEVEPFAVHVTDPLAALLSGNAATIFLTCFLAAAFFLLPKSLSSMNRRIFRSVCFLLFLLVCLFPFLSVSVSSTWGTPVETVWAATIVGLIIMIAPVKRAIMQTRRFEIAIGLSSKSAIATYQAS